MTATQLSSAPSPTGTARPRLAFVGVGWIGRHRMEAMLSEGVAEAAVVCDASAAAAAAACERLPDASRVESFDAVLESGVDGVVIATPNALHASQAIAALERGMAVFCQKPLARTAAETRRVLDAARAANRLLGVDLSYRHTEAMRRIRDLITAGELGRVYAVDLVFHNAYGPDKPWFFDPRLSGGGCVLDLGIHLVDLALWTLDFPALEGVDARLFSRGELLRPPIDVVEDHAVARLDLAGGVVVRLACSWNLPAGQDAVIEAAFYGSAGGAAMRNVSGSFYDFTADRMRGTSRERLASPPDGWGGRAAIDWARRLARGDGFDPGAERLVEVAAALDAIYGR